MRTIIHDLKNDLSNNILFDEKDFVIDSLKCNKNCIGCFSCWVKHPKRCALSDDYSNIVDYLKESDELILISKCRYGCYSSSVKRVLERCIGYVLPYFVIRNNEIHHESRYDKTIKLSVYFYGDITCEDKECINKLVKANAINLNAIEYKVRYFKDEMELIECIRL